MVLAFLSRSKHFSATDLAFQAAACDLQMRQHFCLAWGLEPWACIAMGKITAVPGELFHPVAFMDSIGEPGALGFHDDVAGYEYARVIVPADRADASTASHEAVEFRADQRCDQWRTMADGREVALETGDPVESDGYAVQVTIAGESRWITVSNFVLPAYFIPGSKGPWDYMHRLSGPAPAMTPGGYLILRDPKSGEISQVFADRAAARHFALKKADPTSRLARRLAKAAQP